MSTEKSLPIAIACVVLALGAAGLALVGLGAGAGPTTVASTVRGETVNWLTSGPYAFNAQRTVAEGVGWDAVTLFLAVPALLVCALGVAQGRLFARLGAAGLLAYLFYQYLQYATVWAFGPLFPAFVALFAGALWTLVPLVASLARDLLPRPWPSKFPRRALATLGFGLAALLVLMWGARIAGALGSVQGVLLGQTTLVVQALDLGLVAPFCALVAVMALRRSGWALVLGPVLLVKGLTMALAIAAMLLVAWGVEGRLEVVPLAIFGAVALACGALAWRAFGALK